MHEKITLPNGVRIVYERMDHVRTAAVGIWVGVGSRCEKRGENGAAHFIEHMLFKGTESRTAAELAQEMDAIGGQINAYTTRESTCFYARVLDTHLDTAIDLLSDMFFCSRFDEADVNSERGVIFEEIDMYDDAPDDVAVERLVARSFRGPLGRPVLGTKKSLSALDASALRSFMEAQYVAPRIVLAVSGSFSQSHLDHLSRAFSTLPTAKAPKISKAVYLPSFTTKRKPVEQNHLCLAFPGASVGHEQRFARQVMSTILGGGMSSRLFQTVREKYGLCYSIYTFGANYRDTGLFGIATALSGETEAQALKLILGELERLRQDGVTAQELERAREQAKASVIMSLESTSSRMNRIGSGELTMGSTLSVDEVIARYDAVTAQDVLEQAGQMLSPAEMSFSAVGRVAPEEHYREILFGK